MDPLRAQPQVQYVPSPAAGGAQYIHPGAIPGHQSYGAGLTQPMYIPQAGIPQPQSRYPVHSQGILPQQVGQQALPAGYGTSPAAQYIAATQAGQAQPGMAGVQVPGAASAGLGAATGAAAAHYAQPAAYGTQQAIPQMQSGMAGAGVPGMGAGLQGAGSQGAGLQGAGVPGATMTGSPQSYPGYGQNLHPDDHVPHHHRKKKKSKLRRIIEEALGAGAAGTAYHEYEKHHNNQRHGSVSPVNGNQQAPNGNQAAPNGPSQHPPRGSALGFLHPKGHFVPSPLDYMIEHFMQGKRERNLAPEGSRPGYLHPGGHFVPLAMAGLIPEFAHTLDRRYRRRSGGSRGSRSRSGSSSSGSDYETDSESSYSEPRHGRRRGYSM
jgi:hypothetical protein